MNPANGHDNDGNPIEYSIGTQDKPAKPEVREWTAEINETHEDGSSAGYIFNGTIEEEVGTPSDSFKVIERSAYDAACTMRDEYLSRLQEKCDDVLALINEKRELLADARKLADYFSDAQCECSVTERDSGHLVGCWKPELDKKLADFREKWGMG